MNEAFTRLFQHLRLDGDATLVTLGELVDGYSWIDTLIFEPLDRDRTREIRRWIHDFPVSRDVRVLAFTYRRRIYLEFEYSGVEGLPSERLERLQAVVDFLRVLATTFPDLASGWTAAMYETEQAFYRLLGGRLLVTQPMTVPNEAAVRILN